MCEAKVRELETCDKLIEILRERNGRCEYHEEAVKSVATLSGLVKGLLYFLVPTAIAFLSLQTATLWKLYDHANEREAHHEVTRHGESSKIQKPSP